MILHRTGTASEGDWAWTPPGGARFPAEQIEHCAARELHEEIGLDLEPRVVTAGDEAGWAVYAVEVAWEGSAGLACGQRLSSPALLEVSVGSGRWS